MTSVVEKRHGTGTLHENTYLKFIKTAVIDIVNRKLQGSKFLLINCHHTKLKVEKYIHKSSSVQAKSKIKK